MREFTHDRMIDPGWVPPPGGKYRDGPKARCVVTRATGTTVYFTYADTPRGGPQFKVDRRLFTARFPGVLHGRRRAS